jgi:stage III sporulation protein AG
MESLKKVLGIDGTGNDLTKRPVWRKLNILVLIASAGVLLIVLANSFGSSKGNQEITHDTGLVQGSKDTIQNVNPADNVDRLEASLAQRLEKVLTLVNGVGEVRVTVNLASSTQKDFAVNTSTNNKTTKEEDQKGGNRVITEANENGEMVLVRENQGSQEDPVVVKETKPEVKGVIVVAEGAGDPEVKADLMNAVQVYLDIPLYKVIVLVKEEGR